MGPKWLPKGSPKRAQNGVRNRFELKAAKSQKSQDVLRGNLNFEAPGAHFSSRNGVRNGVRNGISTLTALESLSRASWSAPGALRSRKKDVGSASWAAKRANMSQHSQTGSVRSRVCACHPSSEPPQLWLKPHSNELPAQESAFRHLGSGRAPPPRNLPSFP